MEESPFSRKYRPDDDYQRKKEQMDSNITHHHQCVPSQKRKKSKSPPKKDVKVSFDNVNEKLLVLRDENIHLKQHQRDLEEEVKLIATKMKRQVTQLKRDKILGAGGSMYSKIDEDLDRMIEENVRLQDEEMRLTSQVKKLQKKKKGLLKDGTSNAKKLTSTLNGRSRSRSPSKPQGQDFTMDLENLRGHIEKSNKTILELKHDIEFSKRSTQGNVPTEDLVQQLRLKELQVAQAKAKLEDLMDSLNVKEQIFSQNQSYQNSLLNELKEMQTNFLNLQKENRAFDEAAKTAEFLQKSIEETIKERDRLQKEFDIITKQPFFKRESDDSTFKRISDLSTKIEAKDRGIKESKDNILKIEERIRKLTEEHRTIKIERDTFSEEIERLRIQLDPNALTLADIQKKIHDLDPSLFRQAMKDLQYDGQEPIWAKFDFMERLKLGPNNQPIDENDPVQLRREIERLKVERRDLAAELEKIQNLLKMQVSIDKQNAYLYQNEIEEIKGMINADNKRIVELGQLIAARNQKLLTIAKQTGQVGKLTAAGLAQMDSEIDKLRQIHKDEDALTEFSIATDESEILPQENVLDLIINTANFDRQRLTQLLGNKELLPGAVQTFVTVDFYNHETRNSDLSEGFEPNFSTQFSFKNQVDDFYISYLEKNTVTVEFFLSRAQSAIKLGSAKFVLSKLLEKDFSFQAQEIIHEGGDMGGTFSIGKVLYRMRMRKPIEEAIKWYEQKKQLRIQRDPTTIVNEYQPHSLQNKKRSKVVSIQVLKCFDLKRPDSTYHSKEMQPFFYFQFFTFEYASPVLSGSNPYFDIRKQFEVEVNEQFMEYMKTQVLKIDLIDESVEMKEGQKDYIGSARVPLRDLMMSDEFADNIPVKDELGNETGRMEVRLSCKDYSPYPYAGDNTDANFTISKFAEKEIITKIAEKFALSQIEDIDIIFEMLLEGYETDKITKQRFKDYLLTNMNIREQDIDILLKTNNYIQGKDHIDKSDFRNMFENSVRLARQKQIDEYNERQKKYNQAQTYFKQSYNPNTSTQNVKNPFLDQSINQRVNETPAFDVNTRKFDNMDEAIQKQASLQKQQTPKKDQKTLYEIIKDQVYHVINKFEEVTKNESFADWEQFKKVMLSYTKDEEDVAKFWSFHHIDSKFFYIEQLQALVAPPKASNNMKLYNDHMKRNSSPRLTHIKEKLQQHLIKNDLSLEELFRHIDKNKSKSLSIGELTERMKGILTEEEVVILFAAVDRDQSNEITYDELIIECSKIHCAYVLQKLKGAIEGGKDINLDKIFKTVDNDSSGKMEIIEFNEMLRLLYEKVDKFEVDELFKHFDTNGTGSITKEEFQKALKQPMVLENKLYFTLHDLLTPLQSQLKKFNLKPDGIFDHFSKNKKSITIDDLKDIFKYFLKIDISDDEQMLLQGAIIGSYGPNQEGPTLSKANLANFLTRNYVVKSYAEGNRTIAVDTLKKINAALISRKKQFKDMVQPYVDEKVQQQSAQQQKQAQQQQDIINIRNLKMFFFVNFTLAPYEIENLVDYFDKDHNGLVGVLDIEKEIQFAK